VTGKFNKLDKMHELVSSPLYNPDVPHNHPHSITIRLRTFMCHWRRIL